MYKTAILYSLVIYLSACSREPTPPQEAPPQVGRYQMIQLGTMRRDQYMIDTATGKMWSPVCAVGHNGPECDLSYWSEEQVLGMNMTTEELNAIVQYYREDKKNKKK